MNKLLSLVIIILIISVTYGQDYKRYQIKSGIIEYKIGGTTKGTETIYFDDYGRIEAKRSKLKTTVMGFTQETDQLTLLKGQHIYIADYKEKTITKTVNPSHEMINELVEDQAKLEKLGEELMKNMGGKIIGTETINGKKCDIWEIPSLGSKSWIHESIPIKMETNLMGMKISYIATKIDLNVSVPSNKFELPQGFTEQDSPDMGEMMKKMKEMIKK